MRFAAVVLLVMLFVSTAFGQSSRVAFYPPGSSNKYTPEAYPQALWHTDGMCVDIRGQWGVPYFSGGRGSASQKNAQAYAQYRAWDQGQSNELVRSINSDVGTGGDYVLQTVMEQRTRQVPAGCKIVNGRKVCQFRTETYQVPVQKWVRKPLPEPLANLVDDSETTPTEVVAAMVEALGMDENSVFCDPGAGDGRLVVATAKAGVKAFGIEIDKARANAANRAAQIHGATVYHGDATLSDLSTATHVGVYLHEPQLRAIVRRLNPGTKIASYAHELPGLRNERLSVGRYEIFLASVPLKGM